MIYASERHRLGSVEAGFASPSCVHLLSSVNNSAMRTSTMSSTMISGSEQEEAPEMLD